MSRPFVRGACPRLSAPMETGDGLLARIVPVGPMAIDAFAKLCAAADAHGNGLKEISARGSLQVRGLSPASAPLFTAAVETLDIAVCDGVPVLSDPLPDDPTALIDAHALAAALRDAIAAAGLALAPKVSVIVDGGGRLHLDALSTDVQLRAVSIADKPKLLVSLAGDASSATPLGLVSPNDAAPVVIALLRMIAARGPAARAADVLQTEGVAAFRTVAEAPIALERPIAARKRAETIGLHRLSGKGCAIGVALPFGQAHALDLIALVRMARANGATWIATAPDRTLLVGPIDEMTGFSLATAADHLGFVVDARDSKRRVVACPGAPSCASGLIAARALAAEIAGALPPSQDGVAVHVSGCAKGCAHPQAAPLTIVGTEHGCGIIRDGAPRVHPVSYVSESALVAEAAHLAARETEDA
jgi:precorrin-3B synthase